MSSSLRSYTHFTARIEFSLMHGKGTVRDIVPGHIFISNFCAVCIRPKIHMMQVHDVVIQRLIVTGTSDCINIMTTLANLVHPQLYTSPNAGLRAYCEMSHNFCEIKPLLPSS